MKLLIPIVFALLGLKGCTQQVDELPGAGHWRVINYWAIWCTPCREEIPELNALDESTKLMVFAVNYDGQNGEALRSQAAEMGINFTLLERDPGTALGIERPRVLPTTLLVNPQGAVTNTLVGPQTQKSILDVWRGAQRASKHWWSDRKPRKKKPAEYQPAMKEPLKTGRASVVGPSLLRCFPCGAPADIAISAVVRVTGI